MEKTLDYLKQRSNELIKLRDEYLSKFHQLTGAIQELDLTYQEIVKNISSITDTEQK